MAIQESDLCKVAQNLMTLASTYLPDEVVRALREARDREKKAVAKAQLDAILQNISLAKKKRVGICQDSGLPLFFLKLGTNIQLEGDPNRALCQAAENATREIPLRQNCIHPLTLKNSGTNTGWMIPSIHWDLVAGGDYLEVLCVPKGFGSEIRTTTVWVLSSEDTVAATKRAVLDVVQDTMGEACPPVIIGVGVGGTYDLSALNAKRSLFRSPLGKNHPDPIVANLEREIKEAVNKTGLGPMGFGGETYALAVNIELAGSHTSIVPITVTYQCWADRFASARLYNDGRVEYLSHRDGARYCTGREGRIDEGN